MLLCPYPLVEWSSLQQNRLVVIGAIFCAIGVIFSVIGVAFWIALGAVVSNPPNGSKSVADCFPSWFLCKTHAKNYVNFGIVCNYKIEK